MSSLVLSESARKSWRRIVALWSIMMAGILGQALILHFIMQVPEIADTGLEDRTLLNVLRISASALALLDIAVIFFSRKRLLARPVQASAGAGKRDEEALFTLALARYRLWIFLCAQLCEGMALAGFVLAFVERNVMAFIPFGILGMVLIWMYRPQEQEVEELLRKWREGTS
jgi:hypothetical protein